MNGLLQQIVSGLAMGCVYASLALALVMIYQTTSLVNFAQGEMAMASTFLAWSLVAHGVPYWPAFVATVVVSFAAGMAIERLLIRRFRHAPAHSVIIVMVGLMILIDGIVGWSFGYDVRAVDSPFEKMPWLSLGLVSAHEAGIGLVTLVLMALIFCFFRYTRLGLAMRGAALNPLSSAFVGVNVGLMLSLGWGLAAGIGAVSGMLTAPIVYLDPNMMLHVIIYAFAGAVLGGISNPWGAVFGGLVIGVAENLAGAYVVGTDLKLVFVLGIIVAVLTLQPNGLFGRRIVTRV
jgi:branched-chain amino acid transport system permease protein